jgi:hypothetical protein
MYNDVSLFIDGKWAPASAGRALVVLNPATSEPIGKVAHADRSDLDRALEAADRGFKTWRKVSAFDRSKIMRKAAELLVHQIVHRPVQEAAVRHAFARRPAGQKLYSGVYRLHGPDMELPVPDGIYHLVFEHQVLYVALRYDNALLARQPEALADVVIALYLLVYAAYRLHLPPLVYGAGDGYPLLYRQAGER